MKKLIGSNGIFDEIWISAKRVLKKKRKERKEIKTTFQKIFQVVNYIVRNKKK